MTHQTCANCGALNPANAQVCAACGVNLADFAEALPMLRELQAGRQADRRQELERERTARSAAEKSARQKRQVRLLALAGAGGFVVLLAAILLAVAAAGQARLRREREQAEAQRLQSELQRLAICLNDADFRCTREGALALLDEQPDLAAAGVLLRQARFGLAEQYAGAGRFEPAITELDELLRTDPGDAQALAALEKMYDRYIDYLNGRGQWLKAAGVRMQKEARFPEKEENKK